VQKEALEANIGMEDRRKKLVTLAAENAKEEAMPAPTGSRSP